MAILNWGQSNFQQNAKNKKSIPFRHPSVSAVERNMVRSHLDTGKPNKGKRIETSFNNGVPTAYTASLDQVEITQHGSLERNIRAALKQSLEKNKTEVEGEEQDEEKQEEIEDLIDSLARVLMRAITAERLKIIDVDTLEGKEQLQEDERNGINLLVVQEMLRELEPELAEIGFKPNHGRKLPGGEVFTHDGTGMHMVFHYAFDNSKTAQA